MHIDRDVIVTSDPGQMNFNSTHYNLIKLMIYSSLHMVGA